MKRFIVSVLFAAVFFLGLGSIAQNVGAKFKSDEKALTIIAQARQAIGGQNVASIKGMTVTGSVTKTFAVEGQARTEQGELEINMQLPDKFSKMLKIGKHEGGQGPVLAEKTMDVTVVGTAGKNAVFTVKSDGGELAEKQIVKLRRAEGGAMVTGDGENKEVIIVRKNADGGEWKTENGDVHKVVVHDGGHGEGHGVGMGHHQNEMLRISLALLLTAPEGLDVGYTYAGEESVDGSACDVINAEAAGSSFRLYLDKSSHLPRMISYEAPKPMILAFRTRDDGKAPLPAGEARIFTRKMGTPETAQYQVKFSDFRNVGGVQLPYKWVQTVGGNDDETIDITAYDVNPANIESKFQNEKVFVRTAKPEVQK